MPQHDSRPSFVLRCGDDAAVKRGVSVAAQRIMLSKRRGGVLSIHFVANRRMEWRFARSTCSA